MSLIWLSHVLFNLLVFYWAIKIGRRRPRVPLIVFVWVAPYIGGNLIGGIDLSFAPVNAVGFGIAYLALTDRIIDRVDTYNLRRRIYSYLKICVLATVVGIGAVYLSSEYIDQWRQTPMERVIRGLGSEVLRWLLLFAPIVLARKERLLQKLLKHTIYAGLFYCALGLIQFGVNRVFNYDLFPMVREAVEGVGLVSQSTMSFGLDSRITSICGEPRYFSAYCSLWFLIILILGKRMGFTARNKYFISGIFLLSLILSGSRSGLLILALVGLVAGIIAYYTGRLRIILPLLMTGLFVGLVFSVLITERLGSFGNRNDLSNSNYDGSGEMSLAVSGFRIPIEWQDAAGLTVLSKNPWQLVIGSGPGLWQYYISPWDYKFVRIYFSDFEERGLDSIKSNIQVISRLCDVGLIGMFSMVALLMALYRYGKATISIQFRKEYMVSFGVFLTFLQIPGASDKLVYFMMGVMVQSYWILGVDNK